jgi:uncharacterized integral membrane protein
MSPNQPDPLRRDVTRHDATREELTPTGRTPPDLARPGPAPTNAAPAGSRPPGTVPGVPRTRAAGLWVASVLFAVVLLVLLIFILQNTQRAEISFFGAHTHPPVGVALLLAAVFGILLVALPGTARIVQLRILARRRAERAAAGATGEGPEPSRGRADDASGAPGAHDPGPAPREP